MLIKAKPAREINSAEARAMQEIVYGLCPSVYIKSLGFEPFEWQIDILDNKAKRIWIVAARQSGKSTIISGVPCWTAKYFPKSLSIILAPTQDQAKEDMMKTKAFISLDKTYPKMKHDNDSEIELKNGSRILIITANEAAARGYSAPKVVIFDEASRIDDIVFASVFPMITGCPDSAVYMLSTPHGQQGTFYENMSNERYDRYYVRAPWQMDPDDDTGIIPYPYDEKEYAEMMKVKGIKGYFSPRHKDPDLCEEFLEQYGAMQFRQEFCCEFVETEDAVFTYNQINNAFSNGAELGTNVFDTPNVGVPAIDTRELSISDELNSLMEG